MSVDSSELAPEEIQFNEDKAREAASLLGLNLEIFKFLLQYERDDNFDSDFYLDEDGKLSEELIRASDEFDQMIKKYLEGNIDDFKRIEKAKEIDPYFKRYVDEHAVFLYAEGELDGIGRSGIESRMEHDLEFAREVLEITGVVRMLVIGGAIYRAKRN